MKFRSALRPAALVSLLLACGGENLVLPNEGEPAAVSILQGNDQTGRAGERLAQPIVVLVTDSRGRPVVGAPVALTFPDGEVVVEPPSARTDGDGNAVFDVVLGSRVGPVQGRVTIVPAEGEPRIVAVVRLSALSADAAGMALVGGDGQAAPVGSALPEPLVVQVADVYGNPIAGVPIGWAAEGGGSVSESVVETGADGRSSVTRTLGPSAGVQLTRATAEGMAGSPITFVHQATAGSAARLEEVSGSGQSAVVGTPLPNDLVVRLIDPEGNPVPGMAVAWVVGQGNGTVAPETTPTDGEGRASTRWTLGSQPGTLTATAVVSGVGVVSFSATALPGTPPGLRLLTQPSGTARRGVVLGRQPVVQLVDPSGDELAEAGVPVTVAVAAGPGRVRGTLTRTTGSTGRAVFTDLFFEGPAGRYTLAFGAASYSGVTSGPIELSRAATTLRIEADTPDPSAPGVAVRVDYSLASEGGRPTGEVVVSFEDGATCRAGAQAGGCSVTPSRTGTQSITARYAGDAEFEPASDEEPHTVRSVEPPGPSASLSTVVVEPGTLQVGGSAAIRVTVVDAVGSPIPQVEVQASAAGSGNDISPDRRSTDVSGRAEFQLRSTVAESKTITVVAGGVTLDQRPTVTFTRAPSATSIDADAPDPSDAGEPIEVRVSVRGDPGTPTGAVTVSAGGGLECTALLDRGSGRCSLTPTVPGSVTLRAEYPGDATFLPSEDTEAHQVSAATERILTLRTQPSGRAVPGEPLDRQPEIQLALEGGGEVREAGVTVRAQLSGAGGTLEGTTSVATGDDGRARFTDLAIAGGEGSYTLVFSAEGFRSVASDPIELSRMPTETQIVRDDPDPSAPGQPFEVRYKVRAGKSVPTGTVTVAAGVGGPACTGALDDRGEGSCELTLSGAGEVTLTATYAGNQRFAPSSDEERHRVEDSGRD